MLQFCRYDSIVLVGDFDPDEKRWEWRLSFISIILKFLTKKALVVKILQNLPLDLFLHLAFKNTEAILSDFFKLVATMLKVNFQNNQIYSYEKIGFCS